MLIVLVVVFGVAVLFGLGAISKQLDGMENHLDGLREELQWHTNHTFAHQLREWIETAANDIVKSFEGTKDQTPYDGEF